MTKHQSKAMLILIPGAAAFAAFALLVPFRHGAGFWIAFAAGLLAFALQIPVFRIIGSRSDYLKRTLLGLPLIKVGYLYLGIQTAASFLLFTLGFIPNFPAWFSAVICAVILCTALVCGISAALLRDKVIAIEEKNEQNSAFMRNLHASAKKLRDSASDPALKTALQSLTDNIRFSDPVGGDALIAEENALLCGFEALQSSVQSGNIKQAEAQCEEVQKLLLARNNACKKSKRK